MEAVGWWAHEASELPMRWNVSRLKGAERYTGLVAARQPLLRASVIRGPSALGCRLLRAPRPAILGHPTMPNPDIDWRTFSLATPPSGFALNPYPWYEQLRQHAPVHEMAPGTVLLTRYSDVISVYRSPDVSSDKRREFAPKLGVGTPIFEHHTTSLVFNDAPRHTRVRRLMMGALSQRAIVRMQDGVEALVGRLLDNMAQLPSVDLVDDFAAQIPVDVIGNLLDMPLADRTPLRAWSLAILHALEPAPDADVLARANAAVEAFSAYLRDLIEHRRKHPGDGEVDVLTRLIQGDTSGEPSGEQLTPQELVHNCIFLLNAGHETTANLIGNGMHALLTQHAQRQALQQDPSLITTAIEELLRFESPLQLNNRVTTAPMRLGERTWPAGTFLTLGIGAANRDPEQFDAPNTLNLARKPNHHVAFGHGGHACAGMNVARLEARIAIPRLLARFPLMTLDGEPERDPRLRFRGFRHLPVRLNI
jgi:cytochrome P450